MSPFDRDSKLAYLRRCSAEELEGYWWALKPKDGVRPMGREPFDGEVEACQKRAKALGVVLKGQLYSR